MKLLVPAVAALISIAGAGVFYGAHRMEEINVQHKVFMFANTPLEPMAKDMYLENLRGLEEAKRRGVNFNQFVRLRMGDDERDRIQCQTLLSVSIVYKKYASFQKLLDLGADPNLATPECGTPAMEYAARLDDPRFLRTILNHGGNVNARDPDGRPITISAQGALRWENLKLLLDRGADPNAKGPGGETLAISLAGLNEYEQVADLLRRGVDPRYVMQGGSTIASSVQYNGIDPNSTNYKWREVVKKQLIKTGIKFPVPRYGPPPPDQWPPEQRSDTQLLQAYERSKAANARYEREHPEIFAKQP